MNEKLAFLFPGQGSQAVGMGKELAEAFAEAREVFTQADETLGRPISQLCFAGPEDALKQTENQQPALYTVSMAALAALRARGIEPGAAAGHSLGEYGALACAGAFDWKTGLRLVAARGRAMQAAGNARPGAMAAILAPLETAQKACEASNGGAGVANINSPEQIIVSGTPEGVEAAIAKAKELGVKKAIPLPVSGAFHSPLVAPAVEAMAKEFDAVAFGEPRIPMIANVTADVVPSAAAVRGLLERQITSCVRWVETMERLGAMGFSTFVEVGSGKVLAGLAKRINREWTVLPCSTPAEVEAVCAQRAN